MITRKHRFHGHGSLRYVYQHGSSVRTSECSLKYSLNPKRKDYRLAVVVSKKVAKSAVVRNRIRRRLYEAFRLRFDENMPAYDLVVTVFSDTLETMPADKLSNIVDKLLKSANISK